MAKYSVIPGGRADKVAKGIKTAATHVVGAAKRGALTALAPTMLATNADATRSPLVQAGIAATSFGLGVAHYAGEQAGLNRNLSGSQHGKGRK